MGYGLIRHSGRDLSMIEMGVLKLTGYKDPYHRLQLIHKKVAELILQFKPHDFAIEAPFFGKNVQSMLKLGRAQGVAIATAMAAGLPVTEYSPKKVKQSVTGNGNAEKEQVWKMLRHILSLEEEAPSYDASDALAVAVCHHIQNKPIVSGATGGAGRGAGSGSGRGAGAGSGKSKKAGSWEDFVKQNPGRVQLRK